MAPEEPHSWPCARCGAGLRFAPGAEELTCAHCGFVQPVTPQPAPRAAAALGEIALARGLRDDLPAGAEAEVRSARCGNCGAMVAFQGASHATECPFCASPLVVDTGSHRALKPQAVVPFAISETEARKALTGWLGSLWFAPSSLLEYTRKGRAMTGIYAPFWTFDAASETRYRGQRGEHHTETRSVTVQINGKPERRQEQIRTTRWYAASGQVARRFDDVLVMASQSLPERVGNDLAPWDLSALRPFAPDYLAGFQSEGYTVALAEGHARARGLMARVIEADVRRDIGGDAQRIDSLESAFDAETFKHILLPVWMAAYRYGGKSYRFVVNGQTGKVRGERPWSVGKIAFAVLAVLVLALGAAYLNDPGSLGLPAPEWLGR